MYTLDNLRHELVTMTGIVFGADLRGVVLANGAVRTCANGPRQDIVRVGVAAVPRIVSTQADERDGYEGMVLWKPPACPLIGEETWNEGHRNWTGRINGQPRVRRGPLNPRVLAVIWPVVYTAGGLRTVNHTNPMVANGLASHDWQHIGWVTEEELAGLVQTFTLFIHRMIEHLGHQRSRQEVEDVHRRIMRYVNIGMQGCLKRLLLVCRMLGAYRRMSLQNRLRREDMGLNTLRYGMVVEFQG